MSKRHLKDVSFLIFILFLTHRTDRQSVSVCISGGGKSRTCPDSNDTCMHYAAFV